MGLYFVLGQGYEYLSLVRDERLTLQSSAYGSVFYIPTGFHGLHVTGGLIAFIFLLGRTYAAKTFTHEQQVSAIVVSYYWHFVDVVWIGLFTTIYLIHYRSHDGTSSELDQRQAQAPGRRVRRPAAGARRRRRWCTRSSPVAGGAASAATPGGPSQPTSRQGKATLRGRPARRCHGLDAQGTSAGPSLIGVGAAAVDFQMSAPAGCRPRRSTRSMPRKPVTFTTAADPRTSRLHRVAGRRPGDPDRRRRWTRQARTSAPGQQLFIANCAQCHNFVGAGGALTYGKYAPPLTQSTPTADLRGDADRARGHAGVQRHHAVTPQPRSATSSPTSPGPRRAQPRRLQPGPDRAGHRGPGGVPRRDRLPGARRDLDYREAT